MHGVGQETTKRNRGLMRKPSLFKNMNRHHNIGLGGILIQPKLSKQEEAELYKRMKLANQKRVLHEIKYYFISTSIGLGFFYLLIQFFGGESNVMLK